MNKYIIIPVIIIVIYILSIKKRRNIYEGFEESSENDSENDSEKKDIDETYIETCNYRESNNFGKMCSEKWGAPKCNSWDKNNTIEGLEKNTQTEVLKGYYSNDFMYEIDYETYDTDLIKSETEENKQEKDIPRGIHSSFFA